MSIDKRLRNLEQHRHCHHADGVVTVGRDGKFCHRGRIYDHLDSIPGNNFLIVPETRTPAAWDAMAADTPKPL